MSLKVLAPHFISLALLAVSVQAQNPQLFVVPASDPIATPGASNLGQNVLVYSVNPFTAITNFSSGNATFKVLSKPDGSKFYGIANSGSQTVTEVDSGFVTSRSLGNLGSQATAAVMSLDGRRLAVAAGTVHIFDTTSDTDLIPLGITGAPGLNNFDIAITLDGTRFLALGLNPVGGSQLTSIDTSNNTVAGTLPIQGSATGLSVSPNGLIYVSTQNEVLEINPLTLQITPGGVIAMNARPTKAAFTPDGKYAIVANLTPITGSCALLIDLSSRAVASTIPNFSVVLDRFIVLGATQILAYSHQNASIYQITIGSSGNLSITGYALPGIQTTNVTGVTVSDEVPIGGRLNPKYLFVISSGTLYRLDLTAAAITGQFTPSIPNADLSYAGAASTNAQTTTLLQFGLGQNVAPGAVTNPIVVQALDQSGRPLSGATVTFTTTNSAATLSATTVTTGYNGYAVTYLTAPSTNGPLTVTATSNQQSVAYTISVGNGTGATAGGLTIVAGQGQLVFENFNTAIPGFGSPLTVQVNDINGKPVNGVPVTYTVTQGIGTVIGGLPGGTPGSVIVTTGGLSTDAPGQASVGFLSSQIASNGTGFNQAIITVSAPNTNSVTFYATTTPQQSPPLIQLLKPADQTILSGQAGTVLNGGVVAQVVSVLGQPIPNVSLQLNTIAGDQGPSISCQDTSGNGSGVLTDSTGVASCNVAFNGRIGSGITTANVGYFQNTRSINYQVTVGPPGAIQIAQGNNQSGTPGQKLPLALAVIISDSFGNTLASQAVTWTVLTPGGVTLSNIVNFTDSTGRASATATLGNVAGTAQVRVSAGNVAAVFNLTVIIPSSGILKVSGDGQSAIIGKAFGAPLVVKVVNASGTGVAGLGVTFAVTGGSATLGTSSTTTASDGTASTTVTAGATAGNITVTATSGAFNVSFTLVANLPGPTNITFLNGASFVPNSVSPGAIVTITGSGIAPGVVGLVQSTSIIGPLQTTLAGVSVSFNGIAAPIYYVCNGTCSVPNSTATEMVTVQVPFEIASTGTANVTINSAGGGSGTFPVAIQQYAPGIFESVYSGQKLAVAVRPDGSYVSPTNPALRGENIQLFATGMGQVTPATSTNKVGTGNQNIAAPVVTGLNNGGVRYISAQYAPDMIGVYVITLLVPSDTQTGPLQPIGLIVYDSANNAYFAQSTYIPIQ